MLMSKLGKPILFGYLVVNVIDRQRTKFMLTSKKNETFNPVK